LNVPDMFYHVSNSPSPDLAAFGYSTIMPSFNPVRNHTRTFILDAVDHLTENQGPIAPTRPWSVYFDVAVQAKKPGFDADSFRQGLQEALVQDPDLLALGRRQASFNDHARFVGAGPAGQSAARRPRCRPGRMIKPPPPGNPGRATCLW
jgi:hypothetical protein